MRAVLDPNVLISALLSPRGAPARVLRAWMDGAFEIVISPLLVAELQRALAYPKLRERIPAEEATAAIDWLGDSATVVDDPDAPPPISSPGPGDDYLLALAASERAVLVSGDHDLLSVAEQLPIYAPADFMRLLESNPPSSATE